MSRLQKKCLIATAGGHLLLILVLVFGSAFFVTHSKPDDAQVLDVIPANVVEAAFNSGVKNAQPPAPTPPQPIQQPPQPPPPVPLPPKPVVTPPQPAPPPKPEPVREPEPKPVKVQNPEPVESPEPAPKPVKTAKPKNDIKINLTQVTRSAPSPADTRAAEARREAQRQADARAKAFRNAISYIDKNASSATTVEMPGASSVSYANYASVVKSIYERAWETPTGVANDDADTKVSVTIGSDGSVISARIIDPSGDSRMDASVRRALDRVTFIAPFPDGAKEEQKTFIINFNLKTKRMLG